MKLCTDCGKTKPLTEFNRHRNKPGGYQGYCRLCTKIRSRKYYNKYGTPERNRKYNLQRSYRLSPEQFFDLLDSQYGFCAICDTLLEEDGRNTHVDHSHITNQVRGILCRSCNHLLGNAKDSIELLEKAIVYLKKWEGSS